MTTKEFIKFRKKKNAVIARLEAEIETAIDTVVLPTMDEVRPATASDIVVGAVIYHATMGKKNPTSLDYWHVIEEVRYPNDDFKAYVAEDGCRYGLLNAFVDKD